MVPGDGDATVIVRHVDSGTTLEIARGGTPQFTDDSNFLVLTVEPGQEAMEEAQRARRDDRSLELPTDTLAILPLSASLNGTIRRVARRSDENAGFGVEFDHVDDATHDRISAVCGIAAMDMQTG